MKKMNKGAKIAIIVIACLAVLAVLYFTVGRRLFGSGETNPSEIAYTQTVADVMGVGSGTGMINRFAGIVESQETWSCRKNAEYEVKEVFVEVGDEVSVGTPLFTYDVDKFASDLEQAEIDLERLNNEMTSMQTIREQLAKEAAKAKGNDKANYEIQLQEQDLNIKQKDIDIKTKKLEIDKIKDNMEHATIESELDGVIKSINNGNTEAYGGEGDDSFITVMQRGDYRVKGTINEQNIYDIQPGVDVIVHSRADASLVWHGTIDRIDTENTEKSGENGYMSDTGGQSSSSYPFYVTLESSEGLMLGQHVYLELDYGQDEAPDTDSVQLPEYLLNMEAEDGPFVWVDEDGKLARRDVVLGEYNEEMMVYEITEGLTREDRVAIPMGIELHEGMATADMSEYVYEEPEGGEEMYEEDLGTDGMEEEFYEEEMTDSMNEEEGVLG